jgi:hypothetical protein
MPPKRAKRSIAWFYFQEDPDGSNVARCELTVNIIFTIIVFTEYSYFLQLCGSRVMFAGRPTNLTQHLQRHHRDRYDAILEENDTHKQKQQKIDDEFF